MTVVDNIVVPKVLAVIEKYGKDVLFEGLTGGTYSEVTRKWTGRTSVSVTKKVSPPSPFKRELVDGRTIKEDDLVVFLAASGLTFTPDTGFTVTIDSDKFTVVGCPPLYSGEQIAVYQIHLRR